MKNKFLSVSVGLCLLFMLASQIDVSAQAKTIEAKKVEKTRGASKRELPTDVAPEAKPDKSRAAACCLAFSNYTGYYIDIWIDDKYKGRLAPWDDSYSLCVGSGWTSYYAETVGGTYFWEAEGECDESWILNLKK